MVRFKVHVRLKFISEFLLLFCFNRTGCSNREVCVSRLGKKKKTQPHLREKQKEKLVNYKSVLIAVVQ